MAKEYIEREAAISRIFEAIPYHFALQTGLERAINYLRELPAADVREVRRGHNVKELHPSLFECSVCGWECSDTYWGDTGTYNFCPNCGADMRSVTNEKVCRT